MLTGGHRAAEVGSIQMGELKTRPRQDLKVGKPAEEEPEMARAWLHNRDLMMDYNGKELPLE